MWVSRTKADLIIEVWEKLDCESVGALEIEAIQEAVNARFGAAAVESPMKIARLLADEGAALRHSEIMELWIKRHADQPYEPEFRNLIKLDTLAAALRSLRHLENLRRKFVSASDDVGIRLLRQEVIEAKAIVLDRSRDPKLDAEARSINTEIAEWLTIWLQSPDVFDNWIKLRRRSSDFKQKFGRD